MSSSDTRPVWDRQRLLARIESKVERVTESGCWIWLGDSYHGYPYLQVGRTSKIRAHRLAYTLLVGPIADGLVHHHTCRVRCCVNPAHLRAVTQRENVMADNSRCVTKGLAERTHCLHGHPLSPDNVYHYEGARYCRACRTLRDRKRRELGVRR